MFLRYSVTILIIVTIVLFTTHSADAQVCLPPVLTTIMGRIKSSTTFKVFLKVKNFIDTNKYIVIIRDVTDVLRKLPHSFPFGGPITASERSCSLGVTITTYWLVYGYPVPVPVPVSFPLGGRAIVVGPPVPSEGYVIDFPFISQIYENHTENRVGPWALGLGFSPFPLDEINDALGQLKLRFPPSVNELANLPCYVPSAESILACTKGSQFGYAGACVDSISLDCKASGEKDSSGNDIYKVIRLLGTSHDDVPQDALDGLRQSFPGFSWP